MMYFRYALLLVLNISMFFIAYFASFILPVFAIGKDHLPTWLAWFDTPDNPLDGDEGFITLHAPYLGKQTGIKQFLNRGAWLRRNPSYGFDHMVLGAKITEMPVVISGDILVSDGPNITIGRTTGQSGHVFIRSGNYFEYYSITQSKKDPSKCRRLRLGWKLSGFIQAPDVFPLGNQAQFVLSFKPAGKFTV